MATEERCPTGLLADTPADTDAFGGHGRVASSIAEVVQTEAGGRSIGLEGGWGAGKSTIVKLTSEKLTHGNGTDHRVVMFDMWAHQGDPLRRTFLENLITSIKRFGWVDKEKWDRNLADLARRRREETTRVVPRLTRTGLWLALTLLLIPVGSALISAGATLLASKDASGALAPTLLSVGIFFVFMPAICYSIMTAKGYLSKKRKPGIWQEDGGLSEFPALVTGQSSTESRTIVTQTPDPTSVEFELVFRTLLEDSLGPKNRKLLLVIDNLDRVQPSDALSIWSTLQTFLGHSDYQKADWIDRLWVLIPYDGSAILRLWDRPNDDDGENTDSSLATSFLDKTFQMRFRVPPLLLSNWREFLQDALKRALPNHQEADFHGVYRAFAVNGELEKSEPTLRDLKIFVNQIGTLHRSWQDEFPLSHLACYVLLQKDDIKVHSALLSKKDLEFPKRIIGNQWKDIIAALYFGVPVSEARQLLLRGPIQVALANGDGNALSEYASAHPTGFWAVLEDTVPAGAQHWNSVAPADLAKAATALANSRVFEHADGRPEATVIRSSIRTAAVAVQTWAPFDAATAQGIVAVGRLVAEAEEIIPALIIGASNAPIEGLEEDSTVDQPKVSPSVWMASAFALIKGLVELGFAKQIEKGIWVPLDAQQWVDVSREVAEKDPRGQLLEYFHLQMMVELELDQLLSQRVLPGQIDESIVDAVRTTMATRSSNALTDVASTVFSEFQSTGSIESDQLALMLNILRLSKSAGLIGNEEYTQFATSGNYLHYLYRAASENHPEAVGGCMFGYLEAVPDASQPAEVGNSNAGYEKLIELLEDPDTVAGVVQYFADLVKQRQQLAIVFEMATGKDPIPPFVGKVLAELLISGDVPKPYQLVRSHWNVIRRVFEEDQEESRAFETFLKALPELGELVTDVVDGSFDAGESGLYTALLKSTNDTKLVPWCADGLSSVNAETWETGLRSQGDLIALMIELKARKAVLVLGVGYRDALVKYATSIAGGLEQVLPDKDWHELFSVLNADQQELFRRRAYEILEEFDGKARAEFFDFFGDMLSDHAFLRSAERFIDQVCRPIVTQNNARGIAWVADIAESYPGLLTGHGDQAAANDFKDRVQQHLNDIDKDSPTLADLQRIGSVLGIERVEREESEAESEALSKDVGEASE